jgi:hypothetical protein
MKSWKLLLIAVAFAATGCASNLMKPAPNQTIAPVAAQQSRVIFLRPSSFGGAIQAGLFEATGGDLKFIGISSTGTRVVYDVAPGPHRFMVYSEAADFMEAKLAPGKTYYAVSTPRMGAWKARFSLWPVKAKSSNEFNHQNKDVATWVEKGKWVENTPEGEQWFKANLAKIKATHDEYLPVWNQKTPAELAERTLEEADGLTIR